MAISSVLCYHISHICSKNQSHKQACHLDLQKPTIWVGAVGGNGSIPIKLVEGANIRVKYCPFLTIYIFIINFLDYRGKQSISNWFSHFTQDNINLIFYGYLVFGEIENQ